MKRSAVANPLELKKLVRDVPDFPKTGIVFKDITPLLADSQAFEQATQAMAEPFRHAGVTAVIGIESRGFILGGCVAQHLGVGFIPVRKPGKLPAACLSVEYALEYGTDRLEVHRDASTGPSKVLIVDDVLATGGTASAACDLVRQLGATVAGCSFLIVLSFLNGRKRLSGVDVRTVLEY